MHTPCPGLTVEGSHIVPDREGWKQSVALAGEQHAPGVGINFNSADGAPSKDGASQDASACSCKKCQLIHRYLSSVAAQQFVQPYLAQKAREAG
jgi:hypothetical protein